MSRPCTWTAATTSTSPPSATRPSASPVSSAPRSAAKGEAKDHETLPPRPVLARRTHNSWLSNFGELRRNTARFSPQRLVQIALAVALILTVNSLKWGLHLAAVRSGRGAARWSGLPELLGRSACRVQRGLEVPGLSGLAALAWGVRVPV